MYRCDCGAEFEQPHIIVTSKESWGYWGGSPEERAYLCPACGAEEAYDEITEDCCACREEEA